MIVFAIAVEVNRLIRIYLLNLRKEIICFLIYFFVNLLFHWSNFIFIIQIWLGSINNEFYYFYEAAAITLKLLTHTIILLSMSPLLLNSMLVLKLHLLSNPEHFQLELILSGQALYSLINFFHYLKSFVDFV